MYTEVVELNNLGDSIFIYVHKSLTSIPGFVTVVFEWNYPLNILYVGYLYLPYNNYRYLPIY